MGGQAIDRASEPDQAREFQPSKSVTSAEKGRSVTSCAARIAGSLSGSDTCTPSDMFHPMVCKTSQRTCASADHWTPLHGCRHVHHRCSVASVSPEENNRELTNIARAGSTMSNSQNVLTAIHRAGAGGQGDRSLADMTQRMAINRSPEGAETSSRRDTNLRMTAQRKSDNASTLARPSLSM